MKNFGILVVLFICIWVALRNNKQWRNKFNPADPLAKEINRAPSTLLKTIGITVLVIALILVMYLIIFQR